MNHTFNFQSICDAFTLAASPVAAKEAFNSIRASLDEGHEVKIIMGQGQKPMEFTNVGDFDQRVQKLKSIL